MKRIITKLNDTTEIIDKLFLELSQFTRASTKRELLYSELIMEVGKTYPGMSRHEIALQYIRNAEMPAQPPDPPREERK